MTMTAEKNKGRTSIEKVGKINLIDHLLSKANNSISDSISLTDENCCWISSHKLLLEGIDFDLVYTPLKYLGYKSVLKSFGTLMAHNFHPYGVSLNIGLSKRFCVEDIEELWAGALAAIEEYNISLVSLDLSSSLTGLTISISSQGKQKRELFVQTPKVTSGDLLCITGNLGAAYMGLQLLEREKTVFNNNPMLQPKLDGYKFILKSYLNPQLDISIMEILSNNGIIPSDGYFITNGLADSVKFLCKKHNMGAKIYLNRIPIASETFEMAAEFNIDAITAALNGGDDFQILYSVPLSKYEELKRELPQIDIIGHLTSSINSPVLVTPDGSEIELKAQGWSESISD
jgi:thiamine-monophosphate kinase